MTVFSVSINPGDYHDPRCLNPCGVSPTVQYQIQPIKSFTMAHLQQYVTDITRLPNDAHSNAVLSVCISNTSFQKYESLEVLRRHFDILWENGKLKRLDFDFTQCKILDVDIVQRVLGVISHVQKQHNYNVFVSVSLPINKDLVVSEEYIDLLVQFKTELINLNAINLLIPKEIKKKSVSWSDMVVQVWENVVHQLSEMDSDNLMFVGDISKYIGMVFDCDVISNSNSLLTNAVRNNMIHGEKKNMNYADFVAIWKWCNGKNIGHVQFKWYLSNCKSLSFVINQYKGMIHNGKFLQLPHEVLADHVNDLPDSLDPSLPEYNDLPHHELIRLPSYQTVYSV